MKEITIDLDEKSFRIAEAIAAMRGITVEEVIREIIEKLGAKDTLDGDIASESES